jgi:hypothetical protein
MIRKTLRRKLHPHPANFFNGIDPERTYVPARSSRLTGCAQYLNFSIASRFVFKLAPPEYSP